MLNSPKNKSFLKKLGKIGAGLFSVSRHSTHPQKGLAFWRTENKFHTILAVIIILAVFVPQYQAEAFCPADIVDCVIDAQKWMIELVGKAIGWAAQLLDVFLQNQPISGVFVVDQSWTIIRNFVNLFFILVLIIMAFGTIFNIQKYTWKDMLAPFLIAALFINFSLVIGQYIAGVANGLSGVFLKEIGQISINAAQGSNIQKLATSFPTGADLLSGAASVAVSGIFSLVFMVIVFLAFLSVAIFSLVRLIMIWFLLIISPIAWLGYALPNLKSKTWSIWWKHFLCWCFFLPYYLFFMMFAVGFVKNKNEIGALLPTASGPVNQVFRGPGAINDFLFYVLSLIFLVGGLAMAMKLACASGTGVKMAFGKIETGVRKYAPGAAYVRGGVAGLKERGAEIQEKGLFGIGGAQKARVAEARAKDWLAPAPTTGEIERRKAEATEVDKETKKLQTLNLTLDQLNQRLTKGSKFEQIAAFKLKAENGWLDSTDLNKVNETMRGAGGGRTALGASIITSLKKGKFHEMAQTTAQKEFIFDNLEDTEVKKAFGLDMAESREITNETIAKKLLEIYSGDAREVQDKVAAAVKNNVENFARDKSAREVIAARAITPTTSKAERKLIELAGKMMADKKEVDSWKIRRSILQSTGGMDPTTGDALTAEGRTLAKEIKDNNTLFKEEGDYRASHGILPTVDLTPAQRTDVQRQVEANIASGLIQGLSTEEMKTPEIFNAINAINAAGGMTPRTRQQMLGKKTDRKRREAFDKAMIGPPIPY